MVPRATENSAIKVESLGRREPAGMPCLDRVQRHVAVLLPTPDGLDHHPATA